MRRTSLVDHAVKAALRWVASTASAARRPVQRPAAPGSPRGAADPGDLRHQDRDPGEYPGDHTGPVEPVYAPDLDGEPDPGEIVWAWVPYEEDHARGKDRPVLVVGRDGPWLLALMLSTRDHDTSPGRPGEVWLDLGTGDWDARRRPSEVRTDRVLRLHPEAVRREGAVLDPRRFDQVAQSLRRAGDW